MILDKTKTYYKCGNCRDEMSFRKAHTYIETKELNSKI